MQKTQEMWARSLGREDSPGEGNGNPLQYSCLGNHSPWGRKELDTAELARMHTYIAAAERGKGAEEGYVDKLGHSLADWKIADLEVMVQGHLIMEERIFYM